MNIKLDCRYYTGYKPCGKSAECENCEFYEPMGTSILIIKLAAMGDVLRTTPILTGLKRTYDPCHVTWITERSALPMLTHNPYIDILNEFGLSEIIGILGARFDLMLNFEKEPRSTGLAKLVNAEKKIGFAPTDYGTLNVYNEAARYSLELGLSDPLKFEQNTKTYPEIIYEMAEIPYQKDEYILHIDDEAKAFGRKFAAQHQITDDDTVVGIHTGCGDVFRTKQWGIDNFTEFLRLITRENDLKVLLLGGTRECDMNAEILNRLNSSSLINAGCENSLEQFFALVDLCDILVSLDSLAMHVGIGLKKKVIALFGPTTHREIELYGRGELIVSDLECVPCYRNTCDIHPSCMDAIKPEKVAEALHKQIKDRDHL